MAKEAKGIMSFESRDGLPPLVEGKHPISGEPILLRDPELQVVKHEVNTVTCSTRESFAAAVLALQGANRLVELRDGAEYVYCDDLGGMTRRVVRLRLLPAVTAKMLCLEKPVSFTQVELVRFAQQYPEVLLPEGGDASVFERLQHFVVKSATNVQASVGDRSVSLLVDKGEDSNGLNIPVYWRATSPVFEDGEPEIVTLRMDYELPEANANTGQVSGQLKFTFRLWTPDQAEVWRAAMDDAEYTMRGMLPDFTVIRGAIA